MVQNKLKTIKKMPETGIAIFCGEEVNEMVIPPLPIKTNYYRCDKLFHTEIISPLFETYDTYGYLAITDKVVLFTVKGSQVNVLSKFNFDLPTDTGRGGQSANRLHRIRMEKREVLKDKIIDLVIEKAKQIKSLIISGCAELPKEVKEILESDSRWILPILGLIKIAGRDPITETIEGGKNLIEYKNIDDEKKHITYIDKLLQTDTERLVFGRENILKYDQEKKLEVVYSERKEENILSNVIILSKTGYLKKFDGIIGITYSGITSV